MGGRSADEHRAFPTTRWTLVDRAGTADTDRASEALEQLLLRYLPALRAHLIRTKRIDEHRADDLLQSFVATKFLEKNLAAIADPARGKFRTLVLTALDRFVLNERRRELATKRSPDQALNIEPEALQAAAPLNQLSAPDPFDVEWARELLTEALERMRASCATGNKEDVWAVFEARILRPILGGAPPADYGSLVERFGFRSPGQAANILVTGKRMFQRALRSVVGEYADSSDGIEQEIRDLQEILESPGAVSAWTACIDGQTQDGVRD